MGTKKNEQKKASKPQKSRAVDNTRGSNLWSFNHFRTSILTGLLNDIIDLENQGLEEDHCNIIRKSLEYFVNAATNVPEGGLFSGKALYLNIEYFLNTYKSWNDIEGNKPENLIKRRKIVSKLRERRQDITNKSRRLQYELENNLDQKLLSDSYTAIGEIIKLVPNIFKNLSTSYSDYLKRGGKGA